jgi:phosphatidylglycerol:prolipoprotein diacylglycerol transferase
MYGSAIALSAGTAAATTGLPYFHMGEWNVGIPIQAFGVIVAAGVLIGAALLRRYAEWHGVEDEHIRGLLGWVTIAGFLGAHIFDVLFYEPQKMNEPIASWPPQQWPALIRIWDGISSYGGFVGGAIGFAVYVWWKRLPVRLMADITIVGLLPAFSIGRIGCTVVSDHIGAKVDPNAWYSGLAMDYPLTWTAVQNHPDQGRWTSPFPTINKLIERPIDHNYPDHITAWNLGLIELLYLIPVNAVILWLAFRASKRTPAGFIVVLTGVLYAPVRFFLDFLRPTTSDPLHLGLTFAQWASVAAFSAAVYAASRVLKNGLPADVVAPTSGEAQRQLRELMREEEERIEREKEEKEEEERAEKARKLAEELEEKESSDSDSDSDSKAEKAKAAAKAEKADDEESDDERSDDDDKSDEKADDEKSDDEKSEKSEVAKDEADEEAEEKPAPAKKPAPKQSGQGSKKKKRR